MTKRAYAQKPDDGIPGVDVTHMAGSRRTASDAALLRKYDVALECSLDDLTSRSRSGLALDQTSPSGCAVRNEELLKLAAALEQLPPDQQNAIMLHHLQGVPLAEVP